MFYVYQLSVYLSMMTYLDPSNLFDDENFNLPSYKVVGMQMIPLKVPNIQFLQECIKFEIKITDNDSIVVRNP